MNEISNHISATIKATFKLLLWMLLLGVVIYGMSGTYSVEPGEIAVHTRFGRIIDGNAMPGIHFGLPSPFDEIHKVSVKVMKTAKINDFFPDSTLGLFPATFTVLTDIPVYCITGDNNIVTLGFAIQYNVIDASQYLFKTNDPDLILREIAKSVIIHCLSRMPVDTILTSGKKDIADYIKLRLNQKLSKLETGLQAQFIELKSVSPPQKVKKDFEEVINAGMDKKKAIDNAESYRNQKMSAASAESEKLLQQAMSYRYKQETKSKGEASRFLNRLSEYEKNPELVRKKQFMDFIKAMGQNWPNKIIVDTSQGKPPVKLRLAWPN